MIIALTAALAVSAQPFCHERGAVKAGTALQRPDGGPTLQRLDQLPPANLVLTVLRTIDGCTRPVIVRYDVGKHAN
jgi:hypothetical protein